ncbi:MAG: peptidyl-tRNA hydrolase Pth2 [Halobacteriaceae archaeon]
MKQVIAVRQDLGMGTGKLAAQVAHASLQAVDDTAGATLREWKGHGAAKVVVGVDGESAIHDLAAQARSLGLPHAVVRDAGRTQLESGTVTALAVGPGPEDDVDKVTGELPLL